LISLLSTVDDKDEVKALLTTTSDDDDALQREKKKVSSSSVVVFSKVDSLSLSLFENGPPRSRRI